MFRIAFLLLVLTVGFFSCRSARVVSETGGRAKIEHQKNKRGDIVQFAEKQLGAKYKYAGNAPKTGFDCSGLTCYVLKNSGVTLPRTSSAQSEAGRKVKLENAKPGDLVFFKRGGKGRVFHVAMIYENRNGNPKIIHSTSSRGVVADELLKSNYWRPKVWQVRNVLD